MRAICGVTHPSMYHPGYLRWFYHTYLTTVIKNLWVVTSQRLLLSLILCVSTGEFRLKSHGKAFNHCYSDTVNLDRIV